MKAKKFEQAFDDGADIMASLDLSKARRVQQEQRRVNVDFPTWMIDSLDREASKLGVTRQSVIKVWLAERLARVSQRGLVTACDGDAGAVGGGPLGGSQAAGAGAEHDQPAHAADHHAHQCRRYVVGRPADPATGQACPGQVCLAATQQPCAPWHVIDGTDRQHRALEVGRVLLAGIELDGVFTGGVPGAWTGNDAVQLLGGPGTTQGCPVQ